MVGRLLSAETRGAKSLAGRAAGAGEITPVQVEGLEGPFYVHESLAELLPLAEQGKLKSTVTSLLSPLTRWYGIGAGRWSCSTLTIGWSVIRRKKTPLWVLHLPVLHRGELVGRIDAKAHRRRGVRDHQFPCGAAGALRQTAGAGYPAGHRAYGQMARCATRRAGRHSGGVGR